MDLPIALTIAGSDPSGGAGIQADLKTFAAHKVYGLSAITAITAQNTLGVQEVWPLDPQQVASQIIHLLSDIRVNAVKLGMLATTGIVQAVSEALPDKRLVIDPVICSTSGKHLLEPQGIELLVANLFPRALLVTPNLAEAAALVGRPVTTPEEMKKAAKAISDMGPQAVLVKGGHLTGEAMDILYYQGEYISFTSPRQTNPNTHGTGCTYSAAITANLALGKSMVQSVSEAKGYITQAIAFGLSIGHGTGPTNHFFSI